MRKAFHLRAAAASGAQRVLGVVTGASLLLCLCAILIWARSWRVHHFLTINVHQFTLTFEDGDGGLFWHRDWDDEHSYNLTQSIILTTNEYWAPLPAYARLREEHPYGRWLDRPEADGRWVTRAGWIPLPVACAAFIALPLAWIVIRVRSARSARRGRPKTPPRLTERLRHWGLIACTAVAAAVACLWIGSARWYEWNAGVRGGWGTVSPRRECVVTVIYDSTDTDPALWVNWWGTPNEDRTIHPIPLRLFPKFEWQAISHTFALLFTNSPPPPPPAVVGHYLTIPYWFLFLATALFPAWRGVAGLRRFVVSRRRRRNGYCVACGYDLRASSGRCPECGEVAAASHATKATLG